MTDISKTFTIDPSRPIDAPTKDALRIIDSIARKMNIRYFIAGAQARELLLYNVFGIYTGRATLDVDFGICVDNWNEFEKVKEALIGTGLYRNNTQKMHRLEHVSSGSPIDLLPFGGVEQKNGTIIWPPDLEIIMNVTGFDEALRSSLNIAVDDSLIVPVTSIPALVILKLIAWIDRRADSSKDAQDIWTILSSYHDIVRNRLFEEKRELLAEFEWKVDVAAIKLLGGEIVNICKPETKILLINAFSNANLRKHLIEDIISPRQQFDNENFVKQVEQYISILFETIEHY